MKKICFFMMLAISTNIVMGQDLKDIEKLALLGPVTKAKETVDKYLAVEKNAKKPDGWFYKGYIYNQASKDSAKPHDEASALKYTAFEALKKYREMDPKAPLLEEQTNGPLFDVYVGYASELGVKAYNAKNQAGAFEDFKKGLDVHDYIFANNLIGNGGFKFSALDTLLVLYAALTAEEAKKMDEAAVFYKKLVDADINGDQYLAGYYKLLEYYKDKKDKNAFADVLAKGRKNYPKSEEYWMASESEEAIDGAAKPGVFAIHEDLINKHPENHTLPYNYAVELYHYIYSDEMKNTNTDEYKTKLQAAAKKAIEKKSTLEANFLLANFLYNNSIDISDEARKIKGPKPDDLKKKKALEAESTKNMNDAIPYAEAAVSIFEGMTKTKSSEKVVYKQTLVILKNIYDLKKDTAKVAAFEKKISSAE